MNPITWVISLVKSLLSSFFSDKIIYGLDHAILNIPLPPPSMWMNMGFWRDESDLPSACKALLDQVMIAADLLYPTSQSIPHSPHLKLHLVDVGIGCGDQSLYLTQLKRVSKESLQPQPLFDSYIGITNIPSQAEFARQRLMAATPNSPYKIFCADAADPSTWSEELHASISESESPPQSEDKRTRARTYVVALDTLYHFHPSRAPLFNHAFSTLNASLLAFDLLLSPSATWSQRLLLRLICAVTGTPFANFLTPVEYKALLVRAGYSTEHILMRDISEHVFCGLESYLEKRRMDLGMYGMRLGKFGVAGKVFGWWGRSGIVRGVIVIARRGDVL